VKKRRRDDEALARAVRKIFRPLVMPDPQAIVRDKEIPGLLMEPISFATCSSVTVRCIVAANEQAHGKQARGKIFSSYLILPLPPRTTPP
jgi:hypothetical protein